MKSRTAKRKLPNRFLIFFISIGIIAIISLFTGHKYFNWIYGKNIQSGNETIIFIPNEATFDEVFDLLKREKILINYNSFKWVASLKEYEKSIKGGRYKLHNGMSNNKLINMLRAGLQSPVMVTFNNIRTKNDLAGIISKKIDIDSAQLVSLLSDNNYLKQFNINSETALTIFIPNSYQFYWNTTTDGFIKRMFNEYQKFWNNKRKNMAENINLSPIEVSILASIVDEETIKTDEKPMVAGLYLNRLKKGIRLQADPTIKFALGNFNVNRVINKDKSIDSPYNTYKYAGLPPGPIRIPSIQGIEAVLNPVKHNYLFMCAKEDFSGYHNFARTLQQHNQNAAKYQKELNKRRIWR
ncbi:MAG: endolytic transglycosylase MltG [Marinilabiliaceae bacterium]|nr:endolytic transglycosylase MltG [Marinilabiliaceae bacterium]